MKKITFTLLLSFTAILFSCQNDDDNYDPIVGKWQLETEYINNTPIPFEDCEDELTVYFRSNQNLEITYYEFEFGQETCIEEVEFAKWKPVADGFYQVIYVDEETGEEDLEAESFKPQFQNNTMIIEFEDSFDSQTISYRQVFKRI
ncbi:lipocalin family protein [Aquimarina brevivitae]|uniref:Lipocalin-like protein n=1 Tax=Aquimarina brevivitae TaxID=323412 RepID=A0A4Q7P1D2_9FLAO|nr:lipocalin family protein [Aquimarina brevivitae]RZS93525.1 lipocalin-like protein [Aquimarina brevivitae]